MVPRDEDNYVDSLNACVFRHSEGTLGSSRNASNASSENNVAARVRDPYTHSLVEKWRKAREEGVLREGAKCHWQDSILVGAGKESPRRYVIHGYLGFIYHRCDLSSASKRDSRTLDV